MKIEILSLTVKNCGVLKDVKIHFTDNDGYVEPSIVLGGANGSGKTTVLELIFKLAECLHHSQFSRNGGNCADIHKILHQSEYSVRIELSIENQKYDINLSTDYDFDNDVKYTNTLFIHSSDCFSRPDILDELTKLIEHSNFESTNFFHSSSLAQVSLAPSILYFPCNRQLTPVTGQQIHHEEVKYQWCYRYKNYADFPGSLDSYLIWLDYAEPELFESVIDFLNQLNFEGKTFHIHRKTLSVIVKTRDGHEHPFSQLSSGEQNILIMLLELRRRLIPGSIVLIDEIENSLHPAFQHRLAQNLLDLQKQIPFQLILTTHQPAFVKIFGEKCTRILTEF